MNKIKCQYCHKKYIPENNRDCCPFCGAYNEFSMDENKNVKTKNHSINIKFDFGNRSKGKKGKVPGFISFPFKLFVGIIIFCICIVALGGIIDSFSPSPERQEHYLEYSEDLLTDNSVFMGVDFFKGNAYDYIDNYNVFYVSGKYSEVINCIDSLIENQMSSIETTLGVKDCKVEYLGNVFYIDSISMRGYDYGSSSFTISGESKGTGDIPKVFNIYLITEDGTKIRLKDYSYGVTYNDNIKKLTDIFNNATTDDLRLEANINEFKVFTKIIIELDDKNFEFDIDSDRNATLRYYGLKNIEEE